MSSVELLHYLKKNLGIIIKRLEESGVIAIPTARDHLFIPEVEVDDTGVSLDVNGFLHYIKVPADYQPVKFNLDRPVTDGEYSVVYPGVAKMVSRIARTLYLKAPAGQRTKAIVEVLRFG
ncbi:MAG: hypothetical protein QXY39_07310 [Thermofilaceae archaeon]